MSEEIEFLDDRGPGYLLQSIVTVKGEVGGAKRR
jgi:hypothetical protein